MSPSEQVHLRHRRCLELPRQGPHRLLARPTPQVPGPAGDHVQARPVHQRRPRDHEPGRARRGLRHRGRRRDRPRPRALRALHRREPEPQLQHHHRVDLLVGHRQGAPGRLPGQDRPGHPPRHRRDQGPDHAAGRPTTSTWSSSRSAARSATSRSSRSSRPSGSSAGTSGRDNVCYVHLTLVPYLAPSGEQKTKPTQHSVTELRSRGIQPDVIVCRSDKDISEALKRKISLLCDVPIEAVVSAVDAPQHLRDPPGPARGGPRRRGVPHPGHRPRHAPGRPGRVGAAGRPGRDARADRCASASSASTSTCPTPTCRWSRRCATPASTTGCRWSLDWIDAELVPGLLDDRPPPRPRRHRHPRRVRRAGHRGHGRRRRLRPRARHPVPRAVPRAPGHGHRVGPAPGRPDGRQLHASSTRVTPYPVIDLMDDQADVVDKGGTMRLGAYPAMLAPGSQVAGHLRDRGGLRAPPPPLRGQRPLPGPARRGRAVVLGHLARRPAGRVHRAAGPPLLGGHPGPPRVQEPARPAPPACSASWSGRPWSGPRGASRGSSTSTPSAEPGPRRPGPGLPRRSARSSSGPGWRPPPGPGHLRRPGTASASSATIVHHPGAVAVVRRRPRPAGHPGPPVPRPPSAGPCSRSPPAPATWTASRPRPPPAGSSSKRPAWPLTRSSS